MIRPEKRAFVESLAIWVVTAGLYFILAATTISLTSDSQKIATVWPANAVLLALLLRGKPVFWGNVLSAGLVANVAANLYTRDSLIAPFLYSLSNLIEVVLATLLLRPHLRESAILATPATVGRFIVVAGFIAPAVSGVIGAGTAWAIAHQNFRMSLETWFLSDALGLLVFTPFLLSLFGGDFVRSFVVSTPRERAEAIGIQILTGTVAYSVFFLSTEPLLFVLFGPVMLATFRAGRLGTKFSVILVAVIGAVGTIHNLGPIASFTHDVAKQAILFQCFLAVLLLTCLPVAADLSARRSHVFDLTRNAAKHVSREAVLSKLAMTDALTGVLNRRAFRISALDAITRAAITPFCLLAIDLDRFKNVNDQFGHAAGDTALLHLTSLLNSELGTADVVGRFGGDEFLVLLSGASQEEAQSTVERLHSVLDSTPLVLGTGASLRLSMSCGVACFKTGMKFDELIDAADTQLYAAKSSQAVSYRAA